MRRHKHPGVRPLGSNRYELRATWKDPATGKTKEVMKTVTAASVGKAAALREAMVDDLRHAAVLLERPTVQAYCLSWLRRRRDGEGDVRPLRRGTFARYAQHLDRFCAALGHVFMDELTPKMIEEWLAKEANRPARTSTGVVAGYTLLGMLRIVRTVTRDAQAKLLLSHWPAQGVKAPRPMKQYTEDEPNALSPLEVNRLWTVMRETEPLYFALFAFMAETAVRFCHAHAFEWRDLDLDRGVWQIGRSRYHGEIGPPSKSKSGHHSGALSAELIEVLREQRIRATGDLVFPSKRGLYLEHRPLSKAIARAAKLAGITQRFTPHGCRRTATTQVTAIAGEGMAQKIAGHATAAMARRYNAVDVEAKRPVIEEMARLRREAVGTSIGTSTANASDDSALN